MKLLHQLIDEQGMGCLNRIIAQSDFGKGDQKIRTSDVEPSFAPEPGGEVDFVTVAADCKRDKNDKADHDEQAAEQGKRNNSSKSGQPDSPGKSGDAAGDNI